MGALQRSVAILLTLALAPSAAIAWGARTHRLVTDVAIDLVPPGCADSFVPHRQELQRRSVEPDTVLRKRDGRRETIRHFIDLDAHLPFPFEGFPLLYDAAIARFGRDAVEDNGVLPWAISRLQRELTEQIREGTSAAIVQTAGHLSHYVVDAYQPLHLTKNHDGQHSGNDGVHRRLEVGVVDDRIELYEAALRGRLSPARRITELDAELFQGFVATYPLIEEILRTDRVSKQTVWAHGPLYYRRMHDRLAPLLERQLAAAATLLASIWYTACAEASAPPHLDDGTAGQ
jgi:hypothetical protein